MISTRTQIVTLLAFALADIALAIYMLYAGGIL